jgi:hypothetical protein
MQNSESFQTLEAIERLQQALLTESPTMPTILQEIHRTLKSQPHVTTLLDDDKIAIIVQGLDKQTGSHIAANVVNKKVSSVAEKKKLAAFGMDDLF